MGYFYVPPVCNCPAEEVVGLADPFHGVFSSKDGTESVHSRLFSSQYQEIIDCDRHDCHGV